MIDYRIFERLHYLLVVGFNVFGTAGHQLASRTYMDIVRQDAEDNFLGFMPAKQRPLIYDSGYLGSTGLRVADPLFIIDRQAQGKYQITDYRREFFQQIRQRLGKVAAEIDSINGCGQAICLRTGISPVQPPVDSQMRDLAVLKGLPLKALPEMSLLRVKTGDGQGDLVYTLLINKAFSNISKLLFRDFSRLPENDTLTVVPGGVGCYPNFFFVSKRIKSANLLTRFETPVAKRIWTAYISGMACVEAIRTPGNMRIGLTPNIDWIEGWKPVCWI